MTLAATEVVAVKRGHTPFEEDDDEDERPIGDPDEDEGYDEDDDEDDDDEEPMQVRTARGPVGYAKFLPVRISRGTPVQANENRHGGC